jgi:hypothetical protein
VAVSSNAAQTLQSALRSRRSNQKHLGSEDLMARAYAEGTERRYQEALEAHLERVLKEHEDMRVGLCALYNRCQDYEGHRVDRDSVASDVRLLLDGLREEPPSPSEAVLSKQNGTLTLSTALVKAGVGAPPQWERRRWPLTRERVPVLGGYAALLHQLALWVGEDGKGHYHIAWRAPAWTLERHEGSPETTRKVWALPEYLTLQYAPVEVLGMIVAHIGMDHAIRSKLGWVIEPGPLARFSRDDFANCWTFSGKASAIVGTGIPTETKSIPLGPSSETFLDALTRLYMEVCL